MRKFLFVMAALGCLALAAWCFAQDRGQEKTNPKAALEFVGGPWLNTGGGEPITLRSRRGKPTLVAFWTFGCINCQDNFEAYERLFSKYKPKGVELIAVHTPEEKIEHELSEVKNAIEKDKIDYPVLVDNDASNWRRWNVNVWPTIVVLDGQGVACYYWEGELAWQGADGEKKICQVLDRLLKADK